MKFYEVTITTNIYNEGRLCVKRYMVWARTYAEATEEGRKLTNDVKAEIEVYPLRKFELLPNLPLTVAAA